MGCICGKSYLLEVSFYKFIANLLLILWLNARREVGYLLALGLKKKTQVGGQFLMELLMIALPAFLLSYGLRVFAEKSW